MKNCKENNKNNHYQKEENQKDCQKIKLIK